MLLAFFCAMPFLAAGDAAIEAREGDIQHWIEHYQRERQQQQPVRPKDVQAEEPKRATPGAAQKESKR